MFPITEKIKPLLFLLLKSLKSIRLTLINIFFTVKAPLSLHLSGGSYVGYDLSQIGGSNQPILADREQLHLEFRTAADSGLLFYTGRRKLADDSIMEGWQCQPPQN